MVNRSMAAKWRTAKMRKRRTAPKAFANKASGGLNHHAIRENAIFQTNARGGGRTEYMMQRLQHFINTRKPHHRILYWIFSQAIRHASEEMYQPDIPATVYEGYKTFNRTESGFGIENEVEKVFVPKEELHPKIAVELLEDLYAQQDESLKVFQFNAVVLEKSDYHFVTMFFRGQECFLVFRRGHEVRMSKTYTSATFLKRLPLKKVEWAGEPYHLDNESLSQIGC